MKNSLQFLKAETWHNPRKDHSNKKPLQCEQVQALQQLKYAVKSYHKYARRFDCIVMEDFLELHRQTNPTMPSQ